MRVELHPARSDGDAPVRVILLPGAYQQPEDVVHAGFAAAIRARGLAVDLAIVELTLAHVTDREALLHLQREVLAPARAAGCRQLWLAGISLGGFMALLYMARYPAEVDGLCLLAPYLGNRMMLAEIARYPSLADWYVGAANAANDELSEQRDLWRFIAGQAPAGPRWHLGYGTQDRFVAAHRLLASQLRSGAVDELAGGHDWPVWRELWDRFLPTLEQHA